MNVETIFALRVCIVGPLPPPSGGMANQCEQLARLWEQEGIPVVLVRTNPPYQPMWVGGVPILRAMFRFVPYVFKLWRELGRADVVHIFANSGWSWHLFSAPAVWIARLRGLRPIINYRGGNASSFLSRSGAVVLPTLRRAGAVVTPSIFLKRVFEKYEFDADIVPNIIDLSRFKRRDRIELNSEPHLIVTRNLEPIYDIPTAIRAFCVIKKRFVGARLTIAGSGPERAALESLVRQLDLRDNVIFSGRIDNKEIPALYASADCMLNSSTVDNMPISILEALACGVPVVSTAVGGIPDMVEDDVSALLVPVGDAEFMGKQAIRILSDSRLAVRLISGGDKVAQSYSWPVVRKYWLEVYRKCQR